MMLHYVANDLASIKFRHNIYSCFDRLTASKSCCTNNVVFVLVLCKLRFCHLRLRLRQKKLRLRQKILGLCKFVKIGNFYSLNWKRHLCFLFNTSHSSHQHFVICMMHGIVFAKTRRKVNVVKTFYY